MNIVDYNVGDFITTNKSNWPSLIISKIDNGNTFLICINEYHGDYLWVSKNNIYMIADITSEEKLSILSNFGLWFYEQHKLIYQELIIECLVKK